MRTAATVTILEQRPRRRKRKMDRTRIRPRGVNDPVDPRRASLWTSNGWISVSVGRKPAMDEVQW